jgi:heme/copper-type cytochrome/quinol oxidase subunit 1
MSIGRTLNRGQRVVLVVALGAGLDVAGSWLTASDRLTGWTGYAPLSTSSTLRRPLSHDARMGADRHLVGVDRSLGRGLSLAAAIGW